MQSIIIGLRLIHIVSGIFWVGTTLFTAFFLFPAMSAAGPAAGAVMGGLQRRGMMIILPVSAVLTLLSGLVLFQMVSGPSVAAFARSPVGATFGAAGLLGILGFVLGMAIARPAGMATARIAQQLPSVTSDTERAELQQRLAALQRRATVASRITAFLVLAAAAGMAVARYM